MSIKMMNEKENRGHPDALASVGEIQKQYREYVRAGSGAGRKLEGGIKMLMEVAELKYGKQYARHLERKMEGSGGKN